MLKNFEELELKLIPHHYDDEIETKNCKSLNYVNLYSNIFYSLSEFEVEVLSTGRSFFLLKCLLLILF